MSVYRKGKRPLVEKEGLGRINNEGSGIICITSPKGHRYLEGAINIPARIWKLRYLLVHRMHHHPKLQAAWERWGGLEMKISVLVYCEPEDVYLLARRTIRQLRPELNEEIIVVQEYKDRWFETTVEKMKQRHGL